MGDVRSVVSPRLSGELCKLYMPLLLLMLVLLLPKLWLWLRLPPMPLL